MKEKIGIGFLKIPAVILLTVGVLFFASSTYVGHLMKEETRQMNKYIKEVTQKTALAFEEQIQGYVDTLNGISAAISPEISDKDVTVGILQLEMDNSLMSRYGIIYDNGKGIAADRKLGVIEGEFSRENFFLLPMQGITYISEPSHDKWGEEEVSLISVPVYGENKEPKAVLCGVQTDTELRRAIEIPVIDGQGYFHIIDSKGNILFSTASSDEEGQEENIFAREYEKESSMSTMEEDLKKGNEGIAGYTLTDEESKCVIYTPLEINDWNMVAVVPDSILTEKENEVRRSSLLLLGGVSAVIILLMSTLMIHRKKSREQIKRLAYYDTLTGIYNKNMFLKEAEKAIDSSGENCAVAVIDVCNFKALNKLFGFAEGDKLIINISNILRASLEPDEIYGRETSDHFWILFREKDEDILKNRIEAIFDAIEHSNIKNDKIQYTLTFRCGVCIVGDESGARIQTLVDYAFAARDTLLDIHKNSIAFYNAELNEMIEQKNQIEQNMRASLEREEFMVWLQPKYAIQDQEYLAGAEALTRWKFQGERMIFPDSFIPVFEKNGFITELDMYMLERVCRILRRWMDEGEHCIPISVNQSRVNMYNPNYIEEILEIVDRYRIPHELIEFEITESAVMDDEKQVRAQFWELKRLGFLISMDDFGSGYSSLNLLKDLKTDIVKIDKEFFNEAFLSLKGRRIVESIIRMLQEMGIKVIAEGIEKKEQVDFLKTSGCDYIQGYYYGKPQPVEKFEKECFKSEVYEV